MVAITQSWFRRKAGQPPMSGSPELADDADENLRNKVQNVVTDSSAQSQAYE